MKHIVRSADNFLKRFPSEGIPIAILILSVLIFFGKILLSGSPLFGSDFVLQFYPWKKFIYDRVSLHGALPAWNPYIFSGTPFIANIQASMFYPLGFLFYVMPTEYAYGYTIIIHCVLGLLFMYLFLRSLSVNEAGAFLSAIIFIYNGFFMAHLYAGHLTFVQNYIWIPLIFFYLHRFFKTFYFRNAALGGLFLGIQILGGFPQIAFYTILAVLSFGLFHVTIFLKAKHVQECIRIGLGIATIVCIGFALAAIQLLPTLEFTKLSTRAGGISYWFATLDSLHPKMFLSFLIPEIFGNVVDQTYWLSPNGWYFWETCSYVGILPLFLVFVSVSSSRNLVYVKRFFVLLIISALFLALGKYNPIYPLVYKLPGFHSFRIPAQILFLYVFGMAVVSGLALHHAGQGLFKPLKGLAVFLTTVGTILLFVVINMHFFPYNFFFHLFKTFAEAPIDPSPIEMIHGKITFSVHRSALLFFSAAAVLILFSRKIISRKLFMAIVLVMSMVDLSLFSLQFVKPYVFITPSKKQSLIDQLRLDHDPGRVLPLSQSFLPNDGLLYRFSSIEGYDPLILKRYIHYLQASQNLPPCNDVVTTRFVKNVHPRFLGMLNLKYVIDSKGLLTTAHTVIPRAYLVKRAMVKPEEEILDFMMAEIFDPRNMVVFEPEYRRFLLAYDNGEGFEGSCTITYYDNERLLVSTTANQPSYLVLSEIFYPGWEARIDGNRAPILRGNYLFRVIPLEHGNHEVELRFVSWPFRIGIIISLLTLAGSLWFMMWKRESDY